MAAAHLNFSIIRVTKAKLSENRFIYVEPVKKEQVKIEIIEHFVDDFQPKPDADFQQILADTINKRFLEPFKKILGKNEFSNERIELADSDYFEIEKSLHAGTKDEIAFRFKIPKASALTEKSIRPDICIITQNYAFGTTSTSGMYTTLSGGMASSSNRTINLDLKFVMWDYKKMISSLMEQPSVPLRPSIPSSRAIGWPLSIGH